jgi:disulfide bond formation protein DsbB
LERIPYILAIIVTTISLFFKKFEKIYLVLLCIIFVSSTILSFYHFGIEQGLIKESLVCDINSQTNSLTKEDLLNELEKNNVSCKEVTFKIIGLSLATINTIISLLISSITIMLLIKYEKNR